MKILIDTNIILDLLLEREPFLNNAVELFSKVENKQIDAYLTANSVTDIVYIAKKNYSIIELKEVMLKLLDIVKIISVNENDILNAFKLDFKDFEDALQTQCSLKQKVDYIVTRNLKDFNNSKIKVLSAENLLNLF